MCTNGPKRRQYSVKCNSFGAPVSTLLLGLALFVSAKSLTAQDADLDSLRTVADSLYTLGNKLNEQGQTQEGSKVLGDAAKLFHRTGTKAKENGSCSQAITDFEKMLGIYQKLLGQDNVSVASIYSEIGYLYWNIKDYTEALDNYRRSLLIRLKVLDEDDPLIATTYTNISLIQCELGKYEEALTSAEKALALQLKTLGPADTMVAASYANIGYIHYKQGSYQPALDNHEKALEIELNAFGYEHTRIAKSYTDIGYMHYKLEAYEEALDDQKRALSIRTKLLGSQHPDLATNYVILGDVYKALGRCNEALASYETALEISEHCLGPNHPDIAVHYANIGSLYLNFASYQSALKNFNKALSLRLASNKESCSELASDYNDIGRVYLALGDYPKALENFKQALAIDIDVLGPNHPDVAARYNNLGNVLSRLGSNTEALEYYKKATDIWLALLGPNDPALASVYNNIGVIYANQGNYPSALQYYNKAIALKLTRLDSLDPSLAYTYNNIGNAYESLGKYDKALESYKRALTIWEGSLGQDHPNVGSSCSRIGLTYDALGKTDESLYYLRRSIDIFEQSRGEITSEELRAAYTETVSDRYEAIFAILMRMGKPEQAFAYLERSKSQALKTALTQSGEVAIGVPGMQEKVAGSQELAKQVEELEAQLVEEYTKPDSLRSQETVERITSNLARTKAEYFEVAAQVQADPDYSSLVRVNAADIGVLQSELPPGQKLLMTYAGASRLYLFLVCSEGYEVRSVSVGRVVLDSLVVRCRRFCSEENARRLVAEDRLFGWKWGDDGSYFYKNEVAPLKNALAELYSYLIEPFEQELEAVKVLTFIPSGNLYYVPWGALMDTVGDSSVFLSERYNWNVLTSTELFQCIYRRSEENDWHPDALLLVGNPTGAKLPSAEEEVASIKTVYPNSTTLVRSQATEFEVQRNAAHSEVLHLATHCRLNPEDPWESYIYLARTQSTDGHWTVSEITNQSWDKVRLITLSACETAVGGSQPGLEFESIAKAFSLAMESAPSIVATLWPVADESTKLLMVTFYEQLKNHSTSEALRRAQQKLIGSEKYSHPFFWASFVLIGEWR
ncbi:tetratricopeptide repeat protein [candidate division WOR-3 bacterium]|nr:tetratricopeptide repeat protein [candidate division WOR-3 bacterium]